MYLTHFVTCHFVWVCATKFAQSFTFTNPKTLQHTTHKCSSANSVANWSYIAKWCCLLYASDLSNSQVLCLVNNHTFNKRTLITVLALSETLETTFKTTAELYATVLQRTVDERQSKLNNTTVGCMFVSLAASEKVITSWLLKKYVEYEYV